MKPLLTLLLCAAIYVCSAQHSFEIGYTAGINNLKFNYTGSTAINMLNSGSISYKYIGKEHIGGSIGFEITGYKISPYNISADHLTSYRDVYNKYIYLSLPLMVEIKAGKRKVKGIFHTGAVATFAIQYQYSHKYYTYTPPINGQPSSENLTVLSQNYGNLQPMQFGIPIGGGIQVDVSKLLYLTVSIEDRLLFGGFKKISGGPINTLGLKLALGLNANKPKQPKQ